MRGDTYKSKNPSFSSSLLDEIYRSICETDTKHEDLKFYRDTMPKNQIKSSRIVEQDRRAYLIDKWIDQKVSQNVATQLSRKSRHAFDADQDVMFFSSTSSSSDSSSGGFSSSDTESFYGAKSKSSVSAPVPPPIRPKPVRTRPGKTEKTEALFYEKRELHMFGDYHYNSSATEETPKINESIFKSKSRALKIYNNLKNLKQPISPGGKLANFINSIFTNGNSKKSKNPSPSLTPCSIDEERKFKSAQASTCSSASSFSRSCLSKSEKFRDGVKRSVRFYPVSVIVDEDCRPCGHKSLYKEEEEEEESSGLMSMSLPTAWKIGKSPSKKIDNDFKYQVMDKSRRVEEVARDFLREYHLNQNKNVHNLDDDDGDEDDDAASYSSSDLFELDHLSVIGKDRYCEELPVYETTHLGTNRAIANGLRL